METTIEKVNQERGFRLFMARKLSGTSRRLLGKALGVSEKAIRRIEYSQVVPDESIFERAASVLHLSPDYLLHGTGELRFADSVEMRIRCRLDRLTNGQLEVVAKIAEALLQEVRRRIRPA